MWLIIAQKICFEDVMKFYSGELSILNW